MRGVRVVLNNTFTAGGRSAPIFACIYGLSPIEMPGDEIVIQRVPGFVPASDINGSLEEGFILFVRGKYNPNEEEELNKDTDQSNTSEVKPKQPCKEARVAQIYREMVYYPLIRDVRVNYYNMDPTTKVIPANLKAISWMDGCHGQLKLITEETVLDKEKELNIESNKHSPARTGVEQAADCGPMFKKLRKNVRSMPAENNSYSPITSRLTKMLDDLNPSENDTTTTTRTDIVILKGCKRKAIIEGLSKLPSATGDAYNRNSILSGFHDNGQIDKKKLHLPCLRSIIGTYRGPISKDHCLHDSTSLIRKFYSEMYLTGRIEESTFDKEDIVHDTDSLGNKVCRDFSVSRENCQRAKVLSADAQRLARIKMKQSIAQQILIRKETSSLYEEKKYKENSECEKRVSILYHKYSNRSTNTQHKSKVDAIGSFQTIQLSKLTDVHFGKGLKHKSKPTIPQLRAFIQLRDPNIANNRTLSPNYKSLSKLKSEQLIQECIKIKLLPVQKRLFPQVPCNDRRDNNDSAVDIDITKQSGQ